MTIKARIYRGEVRLALPTHTHPDPSEHLASDPHGFLKTWMAPHYPFHEAYRGYGGVTVGEHWTHSPEIIPERFLDREVLREAQPGVPMGKREVTAVGRREWVDTAHLHEPRFEHPDVDDFDEDYEAYSAETTRRRSDYDVARTLHRSTLDRYEKYLNRVEREGVNSYQDLSSYSEHPGTAKPYKMGIVWEAHTPEHYTHGTDYEDELNLPIGSKVSVTGARMFIPKSGVVHAKAQELHPSVFSPEEHLAASLDMYHRSSVSHIEKTSTVPWNRIQFPEPVDVPVEGHKIWNR